MTTAGHDDHDERDGDEAPGASGDASLPYLPATTPTVHRAVPVNGGVALAEREEAPPVYAQVDATPVGLEIARATARRQRRRTVAIGWIVSLALIAIVVVGGYYGYREWQHDEPSGDGTAATDEDLGDLIAELESRGDRPQSAAVGDGPTILAAIRQGAADADTEQVFVQYDSARDHLAVYDRQPATDAAPALVTTSDAYTYWVSANGVVERAPRSAASLAASPDTPLAGGITLDMVLPDGARTAARELALPGLGGGLSAYVVDLHAFEAADAAAYERWVATWTTPIAPPLDSLVADGGTERYDERAVRDGLDAADTAATIDADVLAGVDVPTGETIVVMSKSGDGLLDVVAVVAPDLDIRIEYRLISVRPEPPAAPDYDALFG